METQMEININNSNFGTVGMGLERLDANVVGTGGAVNGAAGIDAGRTAHDAVVFAQSQPVDLASSEPVAEVPDTALLRDDALGKLVSAAFNLPPPPMPSFGG